MNKNLNSILAIFKKDLRGLLPLAVLTVSTLLLEVAIAEIEFTSTGQIFTLIKLCLPWLSLITISILVIAIFQQDPAASLVHDWLTRPISKTNLLLAKCLFLFVVIIVPLVSIRFIFNVVNRYSLLESMLEASAVERPWIVLLSPFLIGASILSRSFLHSLATVIAVFLVIVFIGSIGSSFLPTNPSGITSVRGYYYWIFIAPLATVLLGSLFFVYRSEYRQRNFKLARFFFAIPLVFASLMVSLPSVTPSWGVIFSIQQLAFNPTDTTAIEASIQLDELNSCFPAVQVGNISDLSNPHSLENPQAARETSSDLVLENLKQNNSQQALRDASGANFWLDRELEIAGNGSLAFSTTVKSRGVPLGWRVSAFNVTGTYSSNNQQGIPQLSTADGTSANRIIPYGNVDTHYWLLPVSAKKKLLNDNSTKLSLNYSLAVLSPNTHELEVDNIRRHLPGLGFCSAKLDPIKNNVVVNCFKRGAQPALFSAELKGIPASRVDASIPNYSPKWFEIFSGRHYELTIQSPSLLHQPRVLLTAYETEAFIKKNLEIPGLLGGSFSTCPVPKNSQTPQYAQSTWADKSPHNIRSITVDQGIQLEVLEWAGNNDDRSDRTTIVMLAGLGGTAHSFDDLAPILTEHFRVIGITRRGFGTSSRPSYGYDIPRLSADIIQVLDTLDIDAPIFIGHSIAGEELSSLATLFPSRVGGLIYLDAAYDRSKTNLKTKTLSRSLPPRPNPLPSETISYQALQDYLIRVNSHGIPEGELIAGYNFAGSAKSIDPRIPQAIMANVESPAYGKITAPALAIYAVASSADNLWKPWFDTNEEKLREHIDELFETGTVSQQDHIEMFENNLENSKVLILKDADHWVFISNQDEVVTAIGNFIEKLNDPTEEK